MYLQISTSYFLNQCKIAPCVRLRKDGGCKELCVFCAKPNSTSQSKHTIDELCILCWEVGINGEIRLVLLILAKHGELDHQLRRWAEHG